MSEEILIQHCAPTLAGLKTGSLVTAPCPDVPAVLAQLRQWNRRLSPKGVQILPLRFTPGHVLLYLYRSRQLESDLRQHDAAAILRKKGRLNAKSCVFSTIICKGGFPLLRYVSTGAAATFFAAFVPWPVFCFAKLHCLAAASFS